MQVWDAMTFSSCSWKINGQEPFRGSVHCRIVCSGDLQTMGRWGLVEKESGGVAKIHSAASVYGHEFGRDYRGATG